MQHSLGKGFVVAIAVVCASAAMAEQQKKQTKQKTAAVAISNVQPTLLGQYGEWGAYSAAPESGKVCFVIAKPSTSGITPKGRSRGQAYLFISSRPGDNVKNEISFISGYPFQRDTDATAEIGTTRYSMYTERDGAWIRNVAEEARVVDAMRKGAEITIKGTTTRYATATDQFSLRGLTQAMDRAQQECR